MMKKLFETEVKNVGGVNGEISSPDRSFHYKCSSPLNPILNTTNPEQMLAAGYSICFNSSLQYIMQQDNLNNQSVVNTKVSLNINEENIYFFSIVLEVHIDELEKQVIEQVIKKAHKICPYSNSLKNNLSIQTIIV